MKGLLLWLLDSPLRTALVAAALALSRLFDLFGAALLALVALRKGASAALMLMVMALPLVAVAGVVSGTGMLLVMAVAVLWLPVLGMSLVLRQTGSLALTLQAGAAFTGLVVAAWYVADPQPMVNMRAFLENQVLPLIQQMDEQPTPGETQMQALTRLAPGMMAAGSLLIFSVAVIIGRWWQAIAFNPGGFRDDFHRLRQGRSAAVLVAALVLAAVLTGHPVIGGFAFAGAVTLLFQGIAMLHGVIAAAGQPTAWLWGMYLLMAFLPLPATVLLIVAGGVDNWLDFRRRAGQGVV